MKRPNTGPPGNPAKKKNNPFSSESAQSTVMRLARMVQEAEANPASPLSPQATTSKPATPKPEPTTQPRTPAPSFSDKKRGAPAKGGSNDRIERYDQLGGVDEQLRKIREIVEQPLLFPEVYQQMGVTPSTGVLLHGPPGCGKTKLACAIAGELGLPFFKIAAPEIVAGVSGESETKLRELFNEAVEAAPSIIFIDEIDAIAGKRDGMQREMERRIVAQMLVCMDDLPLMWKKQQRVCIVIGATNRPDSIDAALRRAGRFDREISMGIPNQEGREAMLHILTQEMRIDPAVSFAELAARTPGYVGADLQSLANEAAAAALRRVFAHLPLTAMEASSSAGAPTPSSSTDTPLQRARSRCAISPQEMQSMLTEAAVRPEDFREGFTTVPDTTLDDVGALRNVKHELHTSIVLAIQHPEVYRKVGIPPNMGVLLYGPPGCGKTLLAKAIANAARANFISIKGPELLNKYVGESERSVRTVFSRAAASQPCVLFFDELDALAPKRGNENNAATERVVNQLLTELDGVRSREGVYVIGATNRVDIIDPALLRPGRLDKRLYVPLPDKDDRRAILAQLTRTRPLAEDVALDRFADMSANFTGADLSALVNEAAKLALEHHFDAGAPPSADAICIHDRHFAAAMKKVRPSVSHEDRLHYERARDAFQHVAG